MVIQREYLPVPGTNLTLRLQVHQVALSSIPPGAFKVLLSSGFLVGKGGPFEIAVLCLCECTAFPF